MSTPLVSRIGTVAFDFGLSDCGSTPVLSLMSRRDALTPALFPDVRVGYGLPHPQAMVTRRRIGGGGGSRGVPVLRVGAALLRAPHRAAGDDARWSATLSRASQFRDRSWADCLRERSSGRLLTPAIALRAQGVLRRVLAARLGGTWWGRPPSCSGAGRTVVFGGPDKAATVADLELAIAASGRERVILVARRPGIYAGFPVGFVLDGVVDPWPLIEEAAAVHASPGSDAAMIAGLLGKGAVRDGWDDPVELAAAVLVLGARYVDPFSGRSVGCEAFLDLAEDWRRHAATKASIACCVGISFWKRERIGAVLGDAGRPVFCKAAAVAVELAARRGGAIAVWPSREPAGLAAMAAEARVPLFRIEDGFIRSVGLGAEFRPPLSVVLDRLGLYYDATAPSDLEEILGHARFDPAMLARAGALRARMVAAGITKYNLDGAVELDVPRDRPVILVPGQVADDRSVLLGGGGVLAGLDLLARVRAQAPGATIVYKPHPDVEAGYRAGAISDADALCHADRVVRGGSMAALLDQVDEVHTLTSLTGFEALLRGKPVTTYGQPFYAGWGLTFDVHPPGRRGRVLPLDALVAATLILYPCYHDPVTGLACGPEIVLDRLADPALHRMTPLMRLRRLQGTLLASLRNARFRAGVVSKDRGASDPRVASKQGPSV